MTCLKLEYGVYALSRAARLVEKFTVEAEVEGTCRLTLKGGYNGTMDPVYVEGNR